MTEEIQKNDAQKNNWAFGVIKTSIFAFVGLALTVGTFFVENSFLSIAVVSKDDVVTEIDYSSDNAVAKNGIVRFEQSEGSILKPSLDIVSPDVFRLNYGKMWGNFLISNSEINFLVDRVVLIPDHAQFLLSFDGSVIKVACYDGDVSLGFLDKDFELDEYEDKYSKHFVNRLLIPRGNQVEIPLSKIDERIEKLLYSKLIKEFKFSAVSLDDEEYKNFVEPEISKDADFVGLKKQEFVSRILNKGVRKTSGTLFRFVSAVEENLTFVPLKKEEVVLRNLFEFLDDAIYYAVYGDEVLRDESFSQFDGYLGTGNFAQDETFQKKYEAYLEGLSVFSPSDKEYVLYSQLLEKKSPKSPYEITEKFWYDVYRGLNESPLFAEQALDNYYQYLDKVLKSESQDLEMEKMFLAYQNQLFDNLFLHYPIFYKDGYFAIKNVLEKEMIDLYLEGQLKEEVIQAFISRKIDFLKRLRKFFFDGEISINESKVILTRLVEEVDKMMSADSGQVAVIELFESQLKDIGNFWGYLNSPEYQTKSSGETHEERYQTYVEEKDKIWSFIDIQNQILGKDAEIKVTIEDVARALLSMFTSFSEMSDVSIKDIEDINQRYVELKATLGGYPFTAVYDRDKEVLKEVHVYGELLSQRAVRLENLLSLLQERFGNLAEEAENEDSEEVTIESSAQRMAKIYIAQKITSVGFSAAMENVKIVEEAEFIYRIEGVSLTGYESTKVTFDYNVQSEKVLNVYMEISGKPVVVSGEYTLEQLRDLVIAENDFSGEMPEPISR